MHEIRWLHHPLLQGIFVGQALSAWQLLKISNRGFRRPSNISAVNSSTSNFLCELNILKIFEFWNIFWACFDSWHVIRDRRFCGCCFFASLRSCFTSGSFHTWVWWAPRHENGEGWYRINGFVLVDWQPSDNWCWTLKRKWLFGSQPPLGCIGSDRPLKSFSQPEATRSRMWRLAWRHSDDQYPGWPHFRSIRPGTKCKWWTRDTGGTSWWSRGKLKGRHLKWQAENWNLLYATLIEFSWFFVH